MSWRKITMKFPGKCIVCDENIEKGELGLWAKDVGVKHENVLKSRSLLVVYVVVLQDVSNVNFVKAVI